LELPVVLHNDAVVNHRYVRGRDEAAGTEARGNIANGGDFYGRRRTDATIILTGRSLPCHLPGM